MGWDKDSLLERVKAACKSKAKEGIRSLLPVSRQIFSHVQESRAPSRVMVTWEVKHHNSEWPRLLPSFPSFYWWACYHIVWNISLISWGQPSQLCPLPTSGASATCSLVECCKRQKRSWLCVSSAQQQQKKSLCHQHYFHHKSKTYHQRSYYEEN